MRTFYLALFHKAYLWSAKHEFDHKPSLFSAVLYVSALQFLNLLTGAFLIESFGLWAIDVSKWVAAMIPVGLFACNSWWASRNALMIYEERNSPSNVPMSLRSSRVDAYVVVTIVAFVISIIAFVYTGP